MENLLDKDQNKTNLIKPLNSRKKFLIYSLAAYILISIVGAILTPSTLKGIMQVNLTKESPISEANAIAILNQVLPLIVYGIFAVIIYILLAIAVGVFTYRAHVNIEHYGKTRFTSGFATGAWYIPFINFVVPYFVFKDLFTLSQKNDELSNNQKPTLVLWWYLTFLLALILNVAFSIYGGSIEIQEHEIRYGAKTLTDYYAYIDTIGLLTAITTVVYIIHFALFIVLVNKIGKWQANLILN